MCSAGFIAMMVGSLGAHAKKLIIGFTAFSHISLLGRVQRTMQLPVIVKLSLVEAVMLEHVTASLVSTPRK